MERHRAGAAKEVFEEVEFLRAVEGAYVEVRRLSIRQFLLCGDLGWTCVNADDAFSVVHQRVLAAVDPFLPRVVL
jgi:hypothetical protein